MRHSNRLSKASSRGDQSSLLQQYFREMQSWEDEEHEDAQDVECAAEFGDEDEFHWQEFLDECDDDRLWVEDDEFEFQLGGEHEFDVGGES